MADNSLFAAGDLQPEWLQNKTAGKGMDKVLFSSSAEKVKQKSETYKDKDSEKLPKQQSNDIKIFQSDADSKFNSTQVNQKSDFGNAKYSSLSAKKQSSYQQQDNKQDGNYGEIFNRRRSQRYEDDHKGPWQKREFADGEDQPKNRFQSREKNYSSSRSPYQNYQGQDRNQDKGPAMFGFSKKTSVDLNRNKEGWNNKQWSEKQSSKDNQSYLQEDFNIPPIPQNKSKYSSGMGQKRSELSNTTVKQYSVKELYKIFDEMIVKHGKNIPKPQGIQGESIEVLLNFDKDKAFALDQLKDKQSSQHKAYSIRINNQTSEQRRPLYKPPQFYKQQQRQDQEDNQILQDNDHSDHVDSTAQAQAGAKIDKADTNIQEPVLSNEQSKVDIVNGVDVGVTGDQAQGLSKPEENIGNSPQLSVEDARKMNISHRSLQIDQWMYLDPQNNVQGPFSSRDILQWYDQGFFSVNLPIKAAIVQGNSRSHFNPLEDFVSVWRGTTGITLSTERELFHNSVTPSAKHAKNEKETSDVNQNQNEVDQSNQLADDVRKNVLGLFQQEAKSESDVNQLPNNLNLVSSEHPLSNEQYDTLHQGPTYNPLQSNTLLQSLLLNNQSQLTSKPIDQDLRGGLQLDTLSDLALERLISQQMQQASLGGNAQQQPLSQALYPQDEPKQQYPGSVFPSASIPAGNSSQLDMSGYSFQQPRRQQQSFYPKNIENPLQQQTYSQVPSGAIGIGQTQLNQSNPVYSDSYNTNQSLPQHISQAQYLSTPQNKYQQDNQPVQSGSTLSLEQIEAQYMRKQEQVNNQGVPQEYPFSFNLQKDPNLIQGPASQHYPQQQQQQQYQQQQPQQKFDVGGFQAPSSQQAPVSQYDYMSSSYQSSHLTVPQQDPKPYASQRTPESRQSGYTQENQDNQFNSLLQQMQRNDNNDKHQHTNVSPQLYAQGDTGVKSLKLQDLLGQNLEKPVASKVKAESGSQFQTLDDIEARMGVKIKEMERQKQQALDTRQPLVQNLDYSQGSNLQQQNILQPPSTQAEYGQQVGQQAGTQADVEAQTFYEEDANKQVFNESKAGKKKKKNNKNKSITQQQQSATQDNPGINYNQNASGVHGAGMNQMEVTMEDDLEQEMEQRDFRQMKQTAVAPWLQQQQQQQSKQGLQGSLVDIQKEQEERQKYFQQQQLEEQQRQLKEQLFNMQLQESKAQHVWGGSKKPSKNDNKQKTLLDIQAEEQVRQEQSNNLQRQQAQQAQLMKQMQSQSKGSGGVWGSLPAQKASSNILQHQQQQQQYQQQQKKQPQTQVKHPSKLENMNQIQQLFANGIQVQTQAQQPSQATQFQHNLENKQAQPQQHIQKGSQVAGSGQVASQQGQVHQQQAGARTQMQSAQSTPYSENGVQSEHPVLNGEFRVWCVEQMKNINGSKDITLLEIVVGLQSNGEVADYFGEYLGKNDKVAQFTKEFLKRRDAHTNTQQKTQSKGPNQVSSNQKKKGKQKQQKGESNQQNGAKGKKGVAQKQNSQQLGYFGVLDSL